MVLFFLAKVLARCYRHGMQLKTFLKNATPDERELVAKQCGTSVEYLYQIAGKHRRASPELATDIELETTALAKKHDDRLGSVSRVSLVKNPRIFAGVAA